jgi:HSP20 family molecular chaperone IbpA
MSLARLLLRELEAPSQRLLSRKFFDVDFPFPKEFYDVNVAMPRVDVFDTGDAVKVKADLPGVPKEKIQAQITNGHLVLKHIFKNVAMENGVE